MNAKWGGKAAIFPHFVDDRLLINTSAHRDPPPATKQANAAGNWREWAGWPF